MHSQPWNPQTPQRQTNYLLGDYEACTAREQQWGEQVGVVCAADREPKQFRLRGVRTTPASVDKNVCRST